MTTPTVETRLKALLEKHPNHKGLVAQKLADGLDDAAIGREVEHATQLADTQAQLTAEKAKTTTLQSEKEQLQAQLAKPGSKPGAKPAKLPAGAAEGQGEIEQEAEQIPATVTAALSKHRDELKGQSMQAKLKRIRELYPTISG